MLINVPKQLFLLMVGFIDVEHKQSLETNLLAIGLMSLKNTAYVI